MTKYEKRENGILDNTVPKMTEATKKILKDFLEDAEGFYLAVKTPRKDEWKEYHGVYNDCRLKIDNDVLLSVGIHRYECREGDNDYMSTLENFVMVNFSGTVLLLEEANYGKWKNFLPLNNERMIQWGFNDDETFEVLKGTILDLEKPESVGSFY
jgi:hypothetical protein